VRLNTPLDEVWVRVAAVGTPAKFGATPPLPDANARKAIVDTILNDSAEAAKAGARSLSGRKPPHWSCPARRKENFFCALAILRELTAWTS